MTKEEFFEKITQNDCTREDKIFRILMARGFLLDRKAGKMILSDNAHPKDFEYLDALLKEHHLGYLVEDELILGPDARYEDAIALFEHDQKIGMECVFQASRWDQLKLRSCGPKVQVSWLEPYVAYYVKAITACGVETDYSCDGNIAYSSKARREVIVGSRYPFGYWHDYILDHILEVKDWNFSRGIPFTEGHQYDLYYKIYTMADYLYQHRIEIRQMRDLAANEIKNSMIRKRTDEERLQLFLEKWDQYVKRPA